MDDTATNIFMEIKEQLGALNANMATVLGKLTQHEGRISKLENKEDHNFKDTMMMWLAKALIVAVVTICSLAGGGTLLKSILNIQ